MTCQTILGRKRFPNEKHIRELLSLMALSDLELPLCVQIMKLVENVPVGAFGCENLGFNKRLSKSSVS